MSPPHGASFDQNTLTSVSPLYARRAPLSSKEIHDADERFRRMSRAVRSLDDGIGRILDALGNRSQDTIVIYLSDNGFLFGEHRRFGKTDAYEESVRVPMVVRYPALLGPDGASATQALVSNIDIAPSLAELAGFRWNADGRSFVPFWMDRRGSIRSAMLIEHCQGVTAGNPPCSGLSFYAHQTRAGGYRGVVTTRYKYVGTTMAAVSCSICRKTPGEVQNLTGAPGTASTVVGLRSKLAALGVTGHRHHDRDRTLARPEGPSRSVAFTFFSPSRFSTYDCRMTHNGAAAPGMPATAVRRMGDLADGNYSFEVAGVDERGASTPHPPPGVSPSPRRNIRLDRCAPGGRADGGDVAFTFSSPSAGSAFECRLSPAFGSRASMGAVLGGGELRGSRDGTWNFEVRAQDIGRSTLTVPPAGWLVRVDRSGPAFRSHRPRQHHLVARSGPPIRADGERGRNRSVPDGPWRTTDCCDGTFSASGLRKGVHTLRVAAHDALGNLGVTVFSLDDGLRSAEACASCVAQSDSRRSPTRRSDCGRGAIPRCSSAGSTGARRCRATTTCRSRRSRKAGTRSPCGGSTRPMNRSSPLTYRWDIDTIPPGLVLTGSPEDGAVTAEPTASFDIWQSEPGALFCALDDAEFAPVHEPGGLRRTARGPTLVPRVRAGSGRQRLDHGVSVMDRRHDPLNRVRPRAYGGAMGNVISLQEYRDRRDPATAVDRLDLAVSRLDPLVKRSPDRIQAGVERELRRISREVSLGRPAEAAERAERLADRLEHPAAHG